MITKLTILVMLGFVFFIWQATAKRLWDKFSPHQQAQWKWFIHFFNATLYLLAAIIAAQILQKIINIRLTFALGVILVICTPIWGYYYFRDQ